MFLGIDVGTTSVKAALFDAAGNRLETYNATYPTQRGDAGRVEQDPDDWIEHIRRAIAAMAGARNLSGLKAIGLTSQVNTHVFVDQNMRPLAPAIVWQDGRCAPEAARLDAQISEHDKIRWWGAPLPVDASHCLARMKWMADHHPDIWQKTRRVMLPKDYCIQWLTGEAVSDPISNIGLVDLELNFIGPLLDLVPGAAERLLPLARMDAIAGTVRTDLDLAGIPVANGTMDAWAGMFGAGVMRAGQGVYLSGTSEILTIISPDRLATPGVLVFPPFDGMTVHAGPTQSGGASVRWYCDLFGCTPKEMAQLVHSIDRGSPGPLFLPHLQGERAPIWDASARGALLGLNALTGKADIARAVFEGVAFSARLLAQALQSSSGRKVDVFNCGGGGFGSHIWNQIRADVMGCGLRRVSVSDPGVLGAAAIAAVACGRFANLSGALDAFVSFDTSYEPELKHHARYNDIFELYQETYAATRTISHRLIAT